MTLITLLIFHQSMEILKVNFYT